MSSTALQKKLENLPENCSEEESLSSATLSPASKAEKGGWSAIQQAEQGSGYVPKELPKLNIQPRDAPSESSMSIASKTYSEMRNLETSAPVIKETVPKSYFVKSAPHIESEDDEDSDEEEVEKPKAKNSSNAIMFGFKPDKLQNM